MPRCSPRHWRNAYPANTGSVTASAIQVFLRRSLTARTVAQASNPITAAANTHLTPPQPHGANSGPLTNPSQPSGVSAGIFQPKSYVRSS